MAVTAALTLRTQWSSQLHASHPTVLVASGASFYSAWGQGKALVINQGICNITIHSSLHQTQDHRLLHTQANKNDLGFPVGLRGWDDIVRRQCPWSPRTGVPNLQDLMLDDLRWGWCNNNRNKTHNKSTVLESSWNHPPHTSLWKTLPWNWSLVPKSLGTAVIEHVKTLH